MFMALLPAISTDYRLFLPYSGMPTLIRIKRKKTGFSRQQRRRVGIQPVNIGPVAKNLTMTKRFFRLRRSRRVQAPVSGIIGFVNRQFMMIRHAQSRFLIEAFDRE